MWWPACVLPGTHLDVNDFTRTELRAVSSCYQAQVHAAGNRGGHGVQESAGTGAVGALVRDAVHAADVAPMGAGAVVEPQKLSGGVSSLADAPDAAQLVKTAAAHALWDASGLPDPNALLEVTSLPLPDPLSPPPLTIRSILPYSMRPPIRPASWTWIQEAQVWALLVGIAMSCRLQARAAVLTVTLLTAGGGLNVDVASKSAATTADGSVPVSSSGQWNTPANQASSCSLW